MVLDLASVVDIPPTHVVSEVIGLAAEVTGGALGVLAARLLYIPFSTSYLMDRTHLVTSLYASRTQLIMWLIDSFNSSNRRW